MLFLMSAGSIWGLGIIEALFLKQIGAAFLPWVSVGNAIIFVLVLPLYTAFADRAGNDRLLIGILLLGTASLAIGWALLELGAPALGYPLLYLLAPVLIDIFNLHWTTYLLDFYDARAAKRLARALFHAHWGEGRDLAQPEAVADVAALLGIERADLLAAIADQRIKDRLKEQTQAAIERGVFGSPFIFVDGEPFWGADRLPHVEAWLARGGW